MAANRGGDRPVEWTPSKTQGIGWENVGVWTIPENPASEKVALRATSLVKNNPPHSSDGQQSAMLPRSPSECPTIISVAGVQQQFAASMAAMAPPARMFSWQAWSMVCAKLIPAARIVNKKAMTTEKNIRIVSPNKYSISNTTLWQ